MLFMGPPELDCEWQDAGLEGIKRFLNRINDFLTNPNNRTTRDAQTVATTKRLHKFLKNFQERVDQFKPNTAVSAFMEWVNDASAGGMQLSDESLEIILVTLSTMAPHLASELLGTLLNKKLQDCSWPTYDAALAADNEVEVAVQVNGKLRGTVLVPRGAQQDVVQQLAQVAIAKWLEGKEIVRIIFVQDRLLNFFVQ